MTHIDHHDDLVFDQRNGERICSRRIREAFSQSLDVVNADHLSPEDKRATLASWASELYVVESKPALRLVPGLPGPILYDDVLSALKSLDHPQGCRCPQ